VTMYRTFQDNATSGAGLATRNAPFNSARHWEARTSITHPYMQINMAYGYASGSGTASYAVLVDGQAVHQWSTSGGSQVGVRGPIDVRPWLDRTDISIQIHAAATGTGQVLVAPLGVELRGSP